MMRKISTLLLATIAVFVLVISCKKETVKPEKDRVLIIFDDSTTSINTVLLADAIVTAGYAVDYSEVNESSWDNTNPSVDNFYAVIHLNGSTYATEMPEAGQLALVDFVENQAGHYVQAEWDGYQIDKAEMLSMQDLVLLDRGNSNQGEVTYTAVPEMTSHAVLKNIPASFLMDVDANGTAHVFAVSPSVVLMTEDTRDAVVVREFGTGKVLGFHHSGNYDGLDHWSNTNIQKIVVNFLNWK